MFATLPQTIISPNARAKTLIKNVSGLIYCLYNRILMKDTALPHYTNARLNILPLDEFMIFNLLQQETDMTEFVLDVHVLYMQM